MNRFAVAVITLLAAVVAAPIGMQQRSDAAVMLEAARQKDAIDGDPRGAIRGYQQIVEDYADDRAVVATALLHMAESYEKLGDPEAREVYQRVVSNYADQPDVFQQAQARLAAAESQAQQPATGAFHTELLWGIGPGHGFSVSPDGSLMTYIESGTLALHNFATGESRPLAIRGTDTFAHDPYISPDGEQVAYGWATRSGAATELRLLSLRGDQGEPRTVWSPPGGSIVSVKDWFPSGDRLVAVVTGPYQDPGSPKIVTVSTVDGQVQLVHSLDWGSGLKIRVSPDGRSLAYSRPASREVASEDIFIVAVDGSSRSVVVQHPSNDKLVSWGPGGTHLLFSSDRSGQPGLWAQRIQDAQPVGEPQLVLPNIDVSGGLGGIRNGTLYYQALVSHRRVKIAELDLTTGKLLRQPVDATERFLGGNRFGLFSPDGETLAYVSWSRRPEGAIVLRSLKTGEEREVPHTLKWVETFRRWRPDGDRLIVRGRDDRGRDGDYVVDVATGQSQPADIPGAFGVGVAPGQIQLLADNPRIARGILTPDGTQILHRDSRYPNLMYSYRVADGYVQALQDFFGRGSWSLSPDGQRIATVSSSEIRLHPAGGGEGEVLWTPADDERLVGVNGWNAWTPDGTALVVAMQEPQNGSNSSGPRPAAVLTPPAPPPGSVGTRRSEFMQRLWVVPVDGSAPFATELVYEQIGLGTFRIHPDGTRIVYDTGASGLEVWALHNLGLEPGR